MANYTTNYNLEKPLQDDFYDVDITNANMDKIDEALNENAEAANDHIANKNNPHEVTCEQIGALPLAGGTVTGDLNVQRTINDTVVKTNLYPTNYALNDEYVSSIGHFRDDVEKAQLVFNETGIALRDRVKETAKTVHMNGDAFTSEVHIDMNAPAIQLNDLDSTAKTRILKNAGSGSDYGTYITDFAADGTRDTLILNRSANKEQKLQLRVQQDDGTDKIYELYGEHHPEVNTFYSTNSVSFARNVDTSFLGLLGGNDASSGAVLELCGKNHASLKGYFRIHAKNGTNSCYMEGRPDGNLYWNGKTIYHSGNLDTSKFNVPVGTIIPFAGDTVPTGFLACSGAAISRTSYANLYSAISTKYGAGDGSTTFNLPNLNNNSFLEGSTTVGTVKSAGLPNITGTLKHGTNGNGMVTLHSGTEAFTVSVTNGSSYYKGANSGTVRTSVTANLDASRSSSVYGNSTTVQPKSVTVKFCIKY